MRKTIICLFLAMVLALSSFGMTVFAAQPDRTFTYDEDTAVPSPNAYQVKTIVDETVMGTSRLKEATDIFVDNSDRVFILDSGNSRILILDKNYHCIKELNEFNYNGEVLTLAVGAQGLFYREANQYLYIADTENDRIIVSDLDGNVSKVYGKPIDELLEADIAYKPQKIIVDNMGIMYVKSANVNTGAMLIDSANNFLGFYGTNKLKLTAAMQLEFFWRSILTDEMNAQSNASFQPVEFNNLFWSEDRFVYAVSPVNESVAATVVKLNALGNNVFPQDIDFETIRQRHGIKMMQPSDLTVDNEGAVTILDQSTGRIFQYDENCNLLAIFGGLGYQQGLFTQPVSLESDSENNLLVLDKAKNTVTVMAQTFYGKMIRSANYLYSQGLYQESVEPWMEVLRMNANYTDAYVGLGKAYMSMGEYKDAMDFFKIGMDQAGYSEAKAALRDIRVRESFGVIAAVVILAMIGILGYDQIKDLFSKIYWRLRK